MRNDMEIRKSQVLLEKLVMCAIRFSEVRLLTRNRALFFPQQPSIARSRKENKNILNCLSYEMLLQGAKGC